MPAPPTLTQSKMPAPASSAQLSPGLTSTNGSEAALALFHSTPLTPASGQDGLSTRPTALTTQLGFVCGHLKDAAQAVDELVMDAWPAALHMDYTAV